ncbi:protein phosphatase 2C domain-containing protein [Microvirga puerhi]|uniref:Protein phosphatase 2C domain-containing protein n=1 Tax=Microvirga puerhi TaxID=2876078 RepID=A0ABS7VUD7_9HYPH|nr:protein phosphatase 2C domain-containing protein [Microvirga puerhi]MBZ6078789.1 protein phosphatase 2C domain-containing protein [Microvirga puerhi]
MFTIVDRISWAGSPNKANEDSFGASGDWAWVIDTSIFPGTAPIMGEKSDAAWLARFTTERLSELAARAYDGNGPALLRHVMEEARVAFLAKAPEARHDFVTWPLGAMTLVYRNGALLDIWTFGDTTAYVRQPDGAVQTIGEAPALRVQESAKAAELLKASGATPKTITETPLFQDWLRGRRERQKQSKGLALLGLDPTAADKLRHEQIPCADGTVILLASDGFSALVDLYQEVDAAGLMAAGLKDGLEPLVQRAREIETTVDPAGTRYPRFKESDDATALLVRA